MKTGFQILIIDWILKKMCEKTISSNDLW